MQASVAFTLSLHEDAIHANDAGSPRAHARLGVAVTRGLLLDLLATRDVAGVDDAMEAFIDVYTTWLGQAVGDLP